MKFKKRLALFLVVGSILYGIAVIVLSLSANRMRFDRETAFASAKYDGAVILADIAGLPAASSGMPEIESGPLAPDLSHADEAWVLWRQTFSAEKGFAAAVDWHRGRLVAKGWNLRESDPDKALFEKGEWTVTLWAPADTLPPQIRREVKWTRDPSIL